MKKFLALLLALTMVLSMGGLQQQHPRRDNSCDYGSRRDHCCH